MATNNNAARPTAPLAAEDEAALASALDENTLAPFQELLSNLTSSDNDKRQRCEKIFDVAKTTRLETTIKQLMRTLRNQEEGKRQNAEMSAVLLRRSIAKDGEFLLTPPNVSQEVLAMMKQELLNALKEDSMKTDNASKSIANKTRDVVIEVAAHSIDDERDEWPELLPFMFGSDKRPRYFGQVERDGAVHFWRLVERVRGEIKTALGDVAFDFTSQLATRE